MRTEVPKILPLFRSEMQVRLLSLVILQPERRWTLSELSTALQAPNSSIHRELGRAEGAGIVVRDAASTPHRFTAARDSPLFEPLSQLLERTVNVEEDLREALEVPGVVVALIHGSWASGKRRPDSDIDVVVIGDAELRTLRRRMRSVASRAGRRIDLALFSEDEFSALRQDGRGFAEHLLNEPTIPLVGDLRESLT